MSIFIVQGQIYHFAGSILSYQPDDHKFLQIYIIANPDIKISTRCNVNNNNTRPPLHRYLIRSMQDMLHLLMGTYNTMDSIQPDVLDYNIVIHANRAPTAQHGGRYNAPSSSEQVIVIA